MTTVTYTSGSGVINIPYSSSVVIQIWGPGGAGASYDASGNEYEPNVGGTATTASGTFGGMTANAGGNASTTSGGGGGTAGGGNVANDSGAAGGNGGTSSTSTVTCGSGGACPNGGGGGAGSTVPPEASNTNFPAAAGGGPGGGSSGGGGANNTRGAHFQYAGGGGGGGAYSQTNLGASAPFTISFTVGQAGNNTNPNGASGGYGQITVTYTEVGTPAPTSLAQSGTANNGGTITITGHGTVNGDTIKLYSAGIQVGSGTVSSGTFSITTTSTFADGTYSITATETDSDGYVSAASSAVSAVVHATAPTSLAQSGTTYGGHAITMTGVGDAHGDTIKLYDASNTLVGTGTVQVGNGWSITTTTTYSPGTYTFTAKNTSVDGTQTSAASSAGSATVYANTGTWASTEARDTFAMNAAVTDNTVLNVRVTTDGSFRSTTDGSIRSVATTSYLAQGLGAIGEFAIPGPIVDRVPSWWGPGAWKASNQGAIGRFPIPGPIGQFVSSGLNGIWASTEADDTLHGIGHPELAGVWASTEATDATSVNGGQIIITATASTVSQTNSLSLSITTTEANEFIVVYVGSVDPTSFVFPNTPTATGLTFHQRGNSVTVQPGSYALVGSVFYATAANPGTYNISIGLQATAANSTAMAIAAYNVAGFDSDSSVPNTDDSTSSNPSSEPISTNQASTLQYSFILGDPASPWSITPTDPAVLTINESGTGYGSALLTEINGPTSGNTLAATLGAASDWLVLSDALDSSHVTGPWASTEADDTFAGVGHPQNPIGAWASTEADDMMSVRGGLLGGVWHSTEAADTFAGVGHLQYPTGSWHSAETADMMHVTGGLLGGVWHSTETTDIMSVHGGVLGGTWHSTETTDAVSVHGGLLSGSWHSTEADDAFAGVGHPEYPFGVWSSTEADDTMSVRGGLLGGSWHSTEADDTMSATGGVLGGVWHSTDNPDTFTWIGHPALTGVWHSTEARDTMSVHSGLLGGVWHSTETADAMSASGGVLNGAWHSTDTKDAFGASGHLSPIGSWHSTEADDTFNAVGGTVGGRWSSTEMKDILNAAGGVLSGSWHSTEADDRMSAHGGVLSGHIAATEADDTLHAQGYPELTGTWSSDEVDDSINVVGGLLGGTMAAAEADDTTFMFAAIGGDIGGVWRSTEATDTWAAGGNSYASTVSIDIFGDLLIAQAALTGGDPAPRNLLPIDPTNCSPQSRRRR